MLAWRALRAGDYAGAFACGAIVLLVGLSEGSWLLIGRTPRLLLAYMLVYGVFGIVFRLAIALADVLGARRWRPYVIACVGASGACAAIAFALRATTLGVTLGLPPIPPIVAAYAAFFSPLVFGLLATLAYVRLRDSRSATEAQRASARARRDAAEIEMRTVNEALHPIRVVSALREIEALYARDAVGAGARLDALAAPLLAAGIATAATPSAPAPAAAPAAIDALMDFAHVYGVVRYFHPSDSLDRVDWNRFVVYGAQRMGGVEARTDIGPALEALFAAPVAGFKVVPKGTAAAPVVGDGPLVEWRHLGYGMDPMPREQPYVSWRTHHKPLHDGGVKPGFFQHEGVAELVKEDDPILRVPVAGEREALVPVSLPMSATKVGEAQDAQLKELAAKLEPVAIEGDTFTRAQAWGNGIAAWNVARHFYPYWKVVPVDWDGVLRKWLAAQPARQSRDELRDQLRRLIAPLDDGHGRIADPADKRLRQLLPITVRPLGDRWVIEASLVPGQLKAGDVIVAVDGKPAARHFEDLVARQSGSPQFARWRAARDFALGLHDATVKLTLARAGRTFDVTLKYGAGKPAEMPRPEPLAEVKPGIYYVDLSRFDKAAFAAARDKLAAARGIVFDMRGYPSRDAADVVRYWLTGPDIAQWMIVPRFDKPFGRYDTGWSFGWQVEGDASIAKPKKVLMMDGRSVSYAESLIGYFAGQKTGRILGERSAGANGNIDIAKLPGGLDYIFTGMETTRHDGSVFHREGFAPDEEVIPTIAGLASGRDEVLERAVTELQQP